MRQLNKKHIIYYIYHQNINALQCKKQPPNRDVGVSCPFSHGAKFSRSLGFYKVCKKCWEEQKIKYNIVSDLIAYILTYCKEYEDDINIRWVWFS